MADTYQTFTIGAEVAAAQGGIGQLMTDLATLVADGASPTQAHVNTVAEDITVMLGAGSTSDTAGGPKSAALLVVVDTTVISTVSTLRALFNQVLNLAAGSGLAQ